ncbi:MAG: S-Ena type endospore appendage [Candidatus Shapirobacteria bacterium]|jgi:hypothetical protein
MAKKIIFLIVIIIALFLLARGWLSDKIVQNPSVIQNSSSLPAQTAGSDYQGSITSLLGLKKSLKCTLHSDQKSGIIDGTIYVSQNKSRAEITIKTIDNKAQVGTFTVIDGQSAYSWTSLVKTGFKMALYQMSSSSNSAQGMEVVNSLQQEYSYKCQPWTPDNNLFIPPTEISFTDLGAFKESTQKTASDVCNLLPEPQKSQCLQGFN